MLEWNCGVVKKSGRRAEIRQQLQRRRKISGGHAVVNIVEMMLTQHRQLPHMRRLIPR